MHADAALVVLSLTGKVAFRGVTMVENTVKVSRSGGGWIVASDGNLEPLLFLSGARAEAQAHLLARSLASAGTSVSVAVHDRADQLVGRHSYFAVG
jgi:hypothetical protein